MTANVAGLLRQAEAAQAAGDTALAVRHLEAALAADPNHPAVLNSLGLRSLHGRDVGRAVELLRRAVRADAQAPALWFNLSTAYRAAGDVEGERSALDSALRLDPYLLRALLARAQLAERQGEEADAVRLYRNLLKTTPDSSGLPPPIVAALDHARDFLAAVEIARADLFAARTAAARAALPDGAATRRFDHAVEIMVGRRRIYQPEPTSLYFPYLAPIQFFDRAAFPWLAELEAATPAIQEELAALLDGDGAGFAPYVAYPPGVPVNQWVELNHSDRWSAQFLWRDGVRQEAVCARCPATAAALDRVPLLDVPGHAPAAFFSLLRPHTRIPPHTGVTNIRSIVHLPLIVPPGCGFRVGSEQREWIIGEAFAFDDTIEHEAWNDSDELRAVLIFDVWNPAVTEVERALLRALHDGSGDFGQGPALGPG